MANHPPLNLWVGDLLRGILVSGMNKIQECHPLYLRQWDVPNMYPQGRVWWLLLEKDGRCKAVVCVGSQKQLGL